ncbi:DUF2470 domain-containing protein [Kitasatospora sp. NPDC004669]|uniref:DUF2470 domain-containing protein n=1 Tax=Kitasatospora sp. NPDC004669 TaxID=3154555 RepID=UPI0033BBAF33
MPVPEHRAQPSPAELCRSILATATTAAVTTDGRRPYEAHLASVGGGGHLVLAVPPDDALAHEVTGAPRGQLAATVDITDIAAIAVRERVRARLSLGGWLSPVTEPDGRGPVLLGFDPAMVALQHGDRTHPVGLDQLVLAEADPLATNEAELITHLADHHPDLVDALTRRLGARDLLGVVRVQPLSLDRHGIVLRLERARSHHDVRLAFHTPLDNPDHAGQRLHELLAEAHTCRRLAAEHQRLRFGS